MRRIRFLLLAILFFTGTAADGASPFFQRGDSNIDGTFDLSDATYTLRFLFFGAPTALGCEDAADSNDDGKLDITDAVYALGFLFLGNAPPPPPSTECGRDPTNDALGCGGVPACEHAPLGGEVKFREAVNYPADCYPTAVALDDFNGDDVLDLVYMNYCAGASIRLGAGDGTFGEAVNYSLKTSAKDRITGLRPAAVASGDFNADGNMDMATVNPASAPESDVSILLGAGDGSFGPSASYFLDWLGAQSFALGDLNADGTLDVVSGYIAGNFALSVLLGAGDGTFGEARGFGVEADSWSLALGDLDQDGALDVAVTGYYFGDSVSVFPGVGDGTLSEPKDHAAGGLHPRSVVLGDLDRDGALDLAVGHSSGVSVLTGRGDGTFAAAVTCAVGMSTHSVTPVDVDGDSLLDLALVHLSNASISILLGFGDGDFQRGGQYTAGQWPMSLATGDLDGDGKLDFAVGNNQSNDISILLRQ